MRITGNLEKVQDKNYSHCYGCGLCTLVCPVWHQNRDVHCTPHGHAKAMQAGGDVNSVGLYDCILCGACEPVCPENIAIMPMLLDLRQKHAGSHAEVSVDRPEPSVRVDKPDVLLLADEALLGRDNLLKKTLALLNSRKNASVSAAPDHGNDILHALQSGVKISASRLDAFLGLLDAANHLIVSDGLLKSAVQQWLPAMKMTSLGYQLSSFPAMQKKLRRSDLYIIESRAYNADFDQMVKHYHQLRQFSGCQFNLDLQRLAQPTGGIGSAYRLNSRATTTMPVFNAGKQVEWILQGRDVERIIVEHLDDGVAMARVSDKPVIHVAEFLT